MIKITIERETITEYTTTENFPIERVPTEKRTQGYGGREEILFHERFEPRDVVKRQTTKTTLLEQQVDDADFNLVKVIQAINNI